MLLNSQKYFNPSDPDINFCTYPLGRYGVIGTPKHAPKQHKSILSFITIRNVNLWFTLISFYLHNEGFLEPQFLSYAESKSKFSSIGKSQNKGHKT